MKKLTNEEFINRANIIHDGFYDYSKSVYEGIHKPIIITCPVHGDFITTPNIHIIKKCECFDCMKDKEKLSTEEFIKKSNMVHNNFYDYSKTLYISIKKFVIVTCPKHGDFKQNAGSHMKGHGCNQCKVDKMKSDTNTFIEKSKEIHNTLYTYDFTNYIDNKTEVIITCKLHGNFNQKPMNHLNGSGCPFCKLSKGEIKIQKILEKNSISFTRQKKFDDCKHIKYLYFDFYLPYYNTCIEFNGKQHYESVPYWGGEEGLKLRLKLDKIKKDFCSKHKINLLIIKYNDDIEDKLNLLRNKS